MANSYTTNYSWVLPEVGLDTDAWGGHLNYNFGDPTNGLDAVVKGISNVANAALPRAGGTITGTVTFSGTSSTLTMSAPLILAANPTSLTHAANKAYVDAGDNTNAVAASTAQATADAALSRAGGTMTGFITLYANPTSNYHPATKLYVDTADGINASAAASAQSTANAAVVRSGDTMTGLLTLSGAPTANLHAATKLYVDAVGTVANAALARTGGTMTGKITLDGDPTSALHASTKQYVDQLRTDVGNNYQPLDADLTAIAGQTGTGFLKRTGSNTWGLDTNTYLTGNQTVTVSGDATGSGATSIALTLSNSGVTAGTYNDSATSVRPFTVDGKGRVTGIETAVTITPDWSNITSKPTTVSGYGITDAVKTTGSAMSGVLTFASSQPTATTAAPNIVLLTDSVSSTSITTAATPNSVKTAYDRAAASLPYAGGTMSGFLTLTADPTSALHAATKQYVDNSSAARLPYTGGTLTGYLTLVGDPTSSYHAATKNYVDNGLGTKLNLSGGTLSGNLTIQNSTNQMAITLGSSGGYFYADTGEAGWYKASGGYVRWGVSNGNFRTNGTITADGALSAASASITNAISAGSITASSGSITNALSLGSQSNPEHAARKDYVDNGLSAKLNLTGGTISGSLTISSTADYITLQDTDGSTFYIHNNSNIAGFLTPAGGWAFYTDTSGNFTASQNITAYSDERLKKDIETIIQPIDKLKQIRGVTYTRKETGERGLGVVAQEVQRVFPELVHEGSEGTLSVAYGNLVGVLIEAVKELSSRVEQLEAR